MTAHTPGPWRITGPNIRTDTALGTGALVAVVKDHFADVQTREAEKEANARLLAASPDLLSALREMLDAFSLENVGVDAMGKNLAAKKQAREAIAKAEGGEQ